MEIHSVLPEERARTDKGETLPWAYRYPDSQKSSRQLDESGPFGRNRSIRYSGSTPGRRTSTRQGTTPIRQKENAAVADFSRLLAKEQADRNTVPTNTSTVAIGTGADIPAPSSVVSEIVPTECILYGYASKASEWKVISRYERIVAPSVICEDYPREDPNLYMNSNSPMGFNRSSIVVHKNLSREAIQKSRIYKGGAHWIKVTFDSYDAAERACFYSPVEIDGCEVRCDMYHGKPPVADVAIPSSLGGAGMLVSPQKAQTISAAGGGLGGISKLQSGKASALAGFEQAVSSTLPRSYTMPDVQYRQPYSRDTNDADLMIDGSPQSSHTASSATATGPSSSLEVQKSAMDMRSNSVPNLPSQAPSDPSSQYMSRAPNVRKAILRPVSEALPPQQGFLERVLRSVPVVSWLLGFSTPSKKPVTVTIGPMGQRIETKQEERQLIGDGPVIKEDGTWDDKSNGWYWGFWYGIDRLVGTDFCGLKED